MLSPPIMYKKAFFMLFYAPSVSPRPQPLTLPLMMGRWGQVAWAVIVEPCLLGLGEEQDRRRLWGQSYVPNASQFGARIPLIGGSLYLREICFPPVSWPIMSLPIVPSIISSVWNVSIMGAS